MSDGGLQRSQEEPGSAVPEPGGSSTLGPRHPHAAGEGGEHDGEREAGPISSFCSSSHVISLAMRGSEQSNHHIFEE